MEARRPRSVNPIVCTVCGNVHIIVHTISLTTNPSVHITPKPSPCYANGGNLSRYVSAKRVMVDVVSAKRVIVNVVSAKRVIVNVVSAKRVIGNVVSAKLKAHSHV